MKQIEFGEDTRNVCSIYVKKIDSDENIYIQLDIASSYVRYNFRGYGIEVSRYSSYPSIYEHYNTVEYDRQNYYPITYHSLLNMIKLLLDMNLYVIIDIEDEVGFNNTTLFKTIEEPHRYVMNDYVNNPITDTYYINSTDYVLIPKSIIDTIYDSYKECSDFFSCDNEDHYLFKTTDVLCVEQRRNKTYDIELTEDGYYCTCDYMWYDDFAECYFSLNEDYICVGDYIMHEDNTTNVNIAYCVDTETYQLAEDVYYHDETQEYYQYEENVPIDEDDYIYSYHSDDRDFPSATDISDEDKDVQFGLELEIEFDFNKRELFNLSSYLYDMSNDLSDFILERDASLNPISFELVTRPFVYNPDNKLDIEFVKNVCDKLRNEPTHFTHCGGHIHIDINSFKGEQAIDYFMYIIHKNKEFFMNVSDRANPNETHYYHFHEQAMFDKIQQVSRYSACNSGDETVEVRFFGGTKCYNTIISRLNLLYNMIKYVNSLDFEDDDDYIKDLEQLDLNQFLKNTKWEKVNK